MRFRQQVGAGSSGTLSMPNDGIDNYFQAREKHGYSADTTKPFAVPVSGYTSARLYEQ
jgi:hypothetical protein